MYNIIVSSLANSRGTIIKTHILSVHIIYIYHRQSIVFYWVGIHEKRIEKIDETDLIVKWVL